MKTGVIELYGDLGMYDWLTDTILDESWFARQLEALPFDISKLELRIHSYGGMTATGLSIYNRARSFSQKKKAINPDFLIESHIDGYAYSAATLPALAGDKTIMHRGSMLMIHNAWQEASGDYREMQKMADYLEKSTKNVAALYAKETGLKEDDLITMMADTTFFTGDEAVAAGFADETDDKETLDKSKSLIYKDMDSRPSGSKYVTCLLHRHDPRNRKDKSKQHNLPPENTVAKTLASDLKTLLS